MSETPKPTTKAQLAEQKRRLVRMMIDKRKTVGEIKRLFATQFKVTPRAAERFITEAYRQIREEVGRDPGDHRADSYTFWQQIVANEKAPLKDRMRAQENLDRILGNHAPTKTAATDLNGNDVPANKPKPFDEVLQDLAVMMGQSGGASCDTSHG